MKLLYLLRHERIGFSGDETLLSNENILKSSNKLLEDDLSTYIVSSTAIRSISTAEILADKMNLDFEVDKLFLDAYGVALPIEIVHRVVESLDEKFREYDRVVVVGHAETSEIMLPKIMKMKFDMDIPRILGIPEGFGYKLDYQTGEYSKFPQDFKSY